MSKLFKSASLNQAPEWWQNVRQAMPDNTLSSDELKRIGSWTASLSDDQLTEEMDRIEKCAAGKQSYYGNLRWGKTERAQLHEYAKACGTKIVEIDPQDSRIQELQAVAAVQPGIVRTASTSKVPLGDAFGLDTKGVRPDIKDRDWESIKGEAKIHTPDTVNLSSSQIKTIGGGEDYLASPNLRVRPGQNSVTQPDAIGGLIKTETEEPVVVWRQNQKERSAKRQSSILESEKALAAKTQAAGIGATTNHHAKFMGDVVVMGKPLGSLAGADELADNGALIKQASTERKASIQRPQDKVEDKSWEAVKPAAKLSDQDKLLSALEASLKKIKK